MTVRARHDSSAGHDPALPATPTTPTPAGAGTPPTPPGPSRPRVLAIAGSDPSGGAGIQADLKSVAAAGGYGMAALTALTAQNTRGVRSVHVPPPGFLRAQLDAVADDVTIDAVKIGMLASAPVAEVVGSWLDDLPRGATTARPALVLDPVMVATSGDRLLDPAAERAVRDLLGRVDVVTPNLPELAVLAAEPPAADWPAALDQARRLAARHGVLVVAKGGHLPTAAVGASGAVDVGRPDGGAPDALVGPDGVLLELVGRRVPTTSTHGTGCSLAAGLATRFARTGDWARALRDTKEWLTAAIGAGEALRVGGGHGPVDHLVGLHPQTPASAVAPPAPVPVPDAAVGPAADVVDRWWQDAAPVRAAIDDLPFVRTLGDGTLDADAFREYLEQDALYLREYARCLARASELAPTRAEQAFWAGGAHGALVTELDLHTRWLGGEPQDVPESPTTRAYLEHLREAGGDYPTLVAAVLPCYWVYQDVGERLAARGDAGHPYAAWLGTYADDAFAEATRQAVEILRRVAAEADDATRERMAAAFRRACEHELAFFDQTGAAAGAGTAGTLVG
ncbi:bifunctional hydroxymethylpyrimidine kinase/phosphomethylpyrimidine kinase [Isoptericola sp. 4D.3]|uniref:Bifunctional hydroxymethylpyrimidine kinase/phosphomethylpyrimidine kinase n=1 Tax=Isoptericola peretonis TaxID=2918523 RepID=A0ABT0J2A5_9MICO|nr:bifunctional hydroxymethylpyrimidine kinase/phosphomethylpyrimidine kinase [Isoptericola sp. 4D.3]